MKTFRLGGVHPSESKITHAKEVQVLERPKTVYIPVSQHLGAPAKILVKRGDEVKTGQLLAESSGFISANVHSSVSGKVTKIDNIYDHTGYKRPAIVIETTDDQWEENIDSSQELKKDFSLQTKDIIEKIKEKGVVGLGGATFPSHVKLMLPEGKKAEYLIINGVECEPYLTSDHRLMMEKTEELIVGIRILMKGLDVNKCIIGIENNKPDAIKKVKETAAQYDSIKVIPLKLKYPQGAEKQLIKAAINREVPSGKLPIEVGAVVNNVGTAFAVYEAIQKNKPLIDRIVTITGKTLQKPGNYLVRIGTPVINLIEKAGGMPEDTAKIINGGPMMGKAINTADIPVVKGTSGIIIFGKSESKRPKEYNCIRCGRCIRVCPMGLEPVLLSKLSKSGLFEKTEKEKIMDCMECGSCQYTCPAGIPLLDYIRLGKTRTGIIIRSRSKN